MKRLARAGRALLLVLGCGGLAHGAGALLEEDFAGDLDPERWEPVRVHDTRDDCIASDDGWLLLALDTLGSDDATVKLRGLRSRQVFPIPAGDRPLRVSVTLDWSDPTNGSYLSAGLALLPAGEPQHDPRQAGQSLTFEFVGVPPGKTARPFLWWRTAGGLRPLYTEGWPQTRRAERVGRSIRSPRICLEITRTWVRLFEDGRLLHEAGPTLSGRVQLLLFVSGHSNYPRRAVRFDEVLVEGPRREKASDG